MALDPPHQPALAGDPDLARREQRLHALQLGATPDPQFDALARGLAEATGTPFAMVNFVGRTRQYFAGLHVADPPSSAAAAAAAHTAANLGRTMPLDYGWCPHVVQRRKALVLGDVCAAPRFRTNPVVDQVGIRAYLGAPLIDHTGTLLGTICAIDRDTHTWGRDQLALIKDHAHSVISVINQRGTCT